MDTEDVDPSVLIHQLKTDPQSAVMSSCLRRYFCFNEPTWRHFDVHSNNHQWALLLFISPTSSRGSGMWWVILRRRCDSSVVVSLPGLDHPALFEGKTASVALKWHLSASERRLIWSGKPSPPCSASPCSAAPCRRRKTSRRFDSILVQALRIRTRANNPSLICTENQK